MPKTRQNFPSKRKHSPIKGEHKKTKGNKKMDETKSSLCKEWLTQQKNEHHKIQLQPQEELVSDDSNDGNLLADLRSHQSTSSAAARKEIQTKVCFACEWRKCTSIFDTYEELCWHVKTHLYEVPSSALAYECEWDLCAFDTPSEKIFRRHVLYHTYMTNLKTLGEQLLLKKEPLPACMIDSRRRNSIPDTENKYICMWHECTFSFELIQDFFSHIRAHCVHEIETHRDQNRNQSVRCQWLNCDKQFTKRLKMIDHLRTHTGERFVACANCGSTFNSYAKFYDHYKRQTLNPEFKCSQCFRNYATEELLSNHMYTHINCVKCTMCDMTCPSPAALAQHFRYRHITERPYKCSECDYGAVTKWDLEKHIRKMHKIDDATYCCDFDCDFACKSIEKLHKHVNLMHGDGPSIYSCHCCDRRYGSGGVLSRHLIKKHGFQLPSGHRRFTYQQGTDGIYRVQTTRIESLEVSEQIMATPVIDQMKAQDITYKLADLKQSENGFSISVVETKNELKTNGQDENTSTVVTMKEEILDEIDIDDGEFNFKGRIPSKNNGDKKIETIQPFTDCIFDANSKNSDELKSIDDFSVMQKYLKKKCSKNKIIITVDEVDESGKLVRRETRDATEFHL